MDEQALLSEHRWVNKQEKRFVDSTRRFSLLYGLFLSLLCHSPTSISPSSISSGSLREPFGMRPLSQSHAPRTFTRPVIFPPAAPRSPLFQLQFTDILSSFIQNCVYSQKSFPKVLPVRQKCVPLHSLSEREAQATSEWIFDRLRTANKTRQR